MVISCHDVLFLYRQLIYIWREARETPFCFFFQCSHLMHLLVSIICKNVVTYNELIFQLS